MSKSFFNYINIDTEGINKGRNIQEVIKMLYGIDKKEYIKVATLLKNKFI